MGRHGRTSPPVVGPARGHRGPRRRHSGARTGLFGASAAVAAGAVAMVTGLLPTPGGLSSGHLFGDTADAGNLARADGTPSSLATDGGAPGGAVPAPAASPARARSHASPTATPSGSPRPSRPVAVHSASATPSKTTVRRVPAPPPATVAAADPRVAAQASQVLELVNAARSDAGCQPLTAEAKVTGLAQHYSEEMAARNFFDHTDPDGKTPWDRAAAAGISNLGGENIAVGQSDAQDVMTSWMNSPGHRANILNCDYRTIGIGVHWATGTESGGPWWTQDFGF